jgi:hypothetical protein
VDEEMVISAVIFMEAGVWNAIAVVTAALLPGAVLRLPAMCTIPLPSDLLLAHMLRAPLLSRPVVALLTLLVLPPLGLLLSRGVVSLLLLLSRRIVLLTLLTLLVLSSSGLLLLLSRGIVLLTLLPSGLLLPFGLGLLLLFLRFGLFILLFLSSVRRSTHSHQEKKRGRTNNSNLFHGVTSIASCLCAFASSQIRRVKIVRPVFLQFVAG